jgi:aldose sugar dehydrogenase
MKHLLGSAFVAVLGLFPCLSNAQLTHQLDSTTLLIDVVLDSSRVNIPWDIVWGPDERLWMTDGKLITRWDPATDVLDTLLERPYGNGMGLALHPDFPNTPQVFAVFDTSAYYQVWSGWSEVFRFDFVNDTLINPTLLTSFGHIHEYAGGRLLFDTTGALVISTGERYNTDFAPVPGNTLRLMPDGSVPPDNPWGDERWTRGHRNAQGLALLPNGSVVNTELCNVGSEVDLLLPGRNYGWPELDGPICYVQDSCDSPLYSHTLPMAHVWQPISGCEFYTSTAIPELTDHLITCGLMSGGLIAVPFNAAFDSALTEVHITGGVFEQPSFAPYCKRIRDIAIKPDGSFYLITNDRDDARIRWVRPETSTAMNENQAHRVQLWPNPTTGMVTVSASPQASLIVMDALGHHVDVPTLRSDGTYQLDLSGQASGLYAIRVTEGITVRTQRVVKR